MSGGVDSSVSAYLLQQQGYEVTALFMKNWEESDENGRCLSSLDYEDVIRVCDQLNIPCYTVNFTNEYREEVFSGFLEDLKKGLTPNPDVLCNREIKFKALFQKALSLGADYLATGHYCRTAEIDGVTHLLKGADPKKDQSYFLHTVPSSVLKQVLFPVGHLEKSAVKKIAQELQLPTAGKKESMGICFIGKRNFTQFIGKHIGYTPGNLETVEGKVVGRHQGVAFYTVGQRKGLGIGGPGEAWFVIGKDIERNAVLVAQGENNPLLFSSQLTATSIHWISGQEPLFPFPCKAKIRYLQQEQECLLTKNPDQTIAVSFSHPQRAITPQQSVVFYQGEICLGGGLISLAQQPNFSSPYLERV